MEGFGNHLEFAKHVSSRLTGHFRLFDIGCSGGLDANWRALGEYLEAFGFDPNVEDIHRLRLEETLPDITYWPAFVVAPPEHPFRLLKQSQPNIGRDPWARFSVAETIAIQANATAQLSNEEKTIRNAWRDVPMADPAAPILLSEFVEDHDITSIDFIKMDVDGQDFEILNSVSDVIDPLHVLGFGLEINLIGSENITDHTFHNTDRFMRQFKFDLFFLSTRRYSNKHLPARYLYSVPAQSVFGRPFQGDALYLRDICAEYNQDFASRLTPEKKLNLAILYSLFSLPDCAAEILNVFEAEITPLIDVRHALDLLAAQAQDMTGIRGPTGEYMDYEEYMRRFRDNDPMFYGAAY